MATSVTTKLASTVFLRPILFIISPDGTENTKNIKNSIVEVMKFAMLSLKPKSDFTKLLAVPIRSTKPIAKKHSITDTMASPKEVFFLSVIV